MDIMKENIKQVARLILELEKTDILKYDESFLARSLSGRISENSGSFNKYLNVLKNSNDERKDFLNSLQINYTEFFRNPYTFSILRKIILPHMIIKKREAGKKEIRIWSAACSSGQEAYSIAITMEEIISIRNFEINYRIFATDRNRDRISNAQKGDFNYSELKNLTIKQIETWFTKKGENYSINSKLKEHIDFSVFDLLDEKLRCPASSIFGNFDLVICSNILFYYGKENQRIILKKTSGCMSGNSFFVADETEREILKNHKFREVFPQSAIFYPPQWSKNYETRKF